MDNLTHTFTGIAIARLGLEKRWPGATLTLAVSSNFPDIDIVSGLWGNVAYLEHHRAITHAFPPSLLLAAALALILAYWPGSNRRFVPTLLLSWLGISLHIVWDLWTSYGTRVLLPFDPTWYSWDLMFIIDPVFLGLLLLGSFGARWFARPRLPGWAMAAALGYIGLRAAAQWMAHGQAQSFAGSGFEFVRALPNPASLNQWRFLARNDDAFVTGSVQAYGTSRTKVEFPRLKPDDLVRRVTAESHAARVFLDFSAFSRLETRQEGEVTVIVWRDLRFAAVVQEGFFCEVKVDDAGRILSERIVF